MVQAIPVSFHGNEAGKYANNFLIRQEIFAEKKSASRCSPVKTTNKNCTIIKEKEENAYAAAKNGIKVALLEKEESVAQTVRTSGVTWIDYAKEFGIPEDCYNPIRTYNFCSPNNTISISDDKPKAAVLDVRKTYRFLADQAKKNGAEIFVNTNVTEVITENGKIVGVKASSLNNEMVFRAKMVIDASGFQSVVSKSLGLVKQWKRFGVGAEYEAEVENVNADTWWLMVGQMYSPAGYAWIFPLGKNLVRIGVGIGKPESEVDPTERLDELIEKGAGLTNQGLG